MNRARGKLRAIFQRTLVGDEFHRHAAPRKLVGERLCGKQVAACAPGGQKHAAIAARHFTRSMIAERGRRRVTAMRKPMPMASERSDEPP